MSTTLTLIQPDDWHLHLRDDDRLQRTVRDAANHYGRAIIMPNLKPPVTNVDLALAYRQRILEALDNDANFTPLMTLYLTDETTPDMIDAAAACPHVYACKLYPSGATTGAAHGVTNIPNAYPIFARMAERGLPLLIHGEIHDHAIDIFDRERHFIDEHLTPLLIKLPELKVVLEHITTAYAVDYVESSTATLAATITGHHLWLNRNDLLAGGLKPHHYCLPVVKRETDRLALLRAATSGNPKFFLGSDSAPHAIGEKESECGCAGIYTSFGGIAYYADIFEQLDAMENLEAFASINGPAFYGLPQNEKTITLVKEPLTIPETLAFGTSKLKPFMAGQTLNWRVK